ncbi:MAG: hypothetical protein M3425_06230, partial [Actinomycetota bacterium]|nr:hypothetical protein [Actinomycetota bacterium]
MSPDDDALAELADRDAVARLHERDATLWSDDAQHQRVVADRLGWLDVTSAPDGWPRRLADTAAAARSDRIDRLVLAGMGGSSLAPEVFAKVFPDGGGLRLALLDSTHPAAVRAALDDADLSTSLVVVSSKSGTTEETRCFAAHAAELVAPDRM